MRHLYNSCRGRACPAPTATVWVSRREALRRGLFGAGSLLLAGGAGRPARAAAQSAKAVVQIWMWGGPSHLDTFDPKPAAGYDYCGPFDKPIPTNADGS